MWWGPPWMGMSFWPIPMLLVIIVCFGMIVMMMRGNGMGASDGRFPGRFPADRMTAREILDARYARGEIDRAEYEDKRRDLAA